MTSPLVSIIIATYNRAHLIPEMINAIKNQSFRNWECLIIDDGSSDDTEIVLLSLIDDDRFVFLKRKEEYQKGLPGCRNMGLDRSRGKYVVFFDDDDIAHPQLLEWSVKEIEAANVHYCRYLRAVFQGEFSIEFNHNDNYKTTILNEYTVGKMICGEVPFNSCQVLWSKECFQEIRFNEELMFAEEWECYTRILLQDIKGISLEKVLYFGRKHANSNTGEFWNADQVRMNSQINAIKIVIDNLKKNNLLNEKLIRHFIRWGFQFKKFEIIDYTLKISGSGIFKTLKYKIGYLFYPFLKPLFNLKSKFKKS